MMGQPEILVIDDEQEMLVSYEKILKKKGYLVKSFLSADQALRCLDQNQNYSLVICDLKMPGMSGMEFLHRVKEEHPHLPIIMVTGYGTLESAFEAVKIGAFDFIEKPFSTRKLLDSVEKALAEIVPRMDEKVGFSDIIGRSKPMLEIFDLIKKVAFGSGNVLITGESGVGKELVARSIHKNSLRRNCPLIPINCGGLPDTLFESELFGYEKGAFTGAFQAKPGLVELANGGTLFLDEICETSQTLQVKMLRMLEDRKIRRIGGKKEIPVDIRVVSATNRNMEEMISKGLVREDLYYRINTIHIHIPPLRERLEDLPLLIEHFLQKLNKKYERRILQIDDGAMETLHRYSWPGNVRELQNVIERSYYLANPPVIHRSDLPASLFSETTINSKEKWKSISYKDAKDQAIEDFERDYLLFQLDRFNWNISKTAEACKMDRRTIHRLINRYNLKKITRPK